MMGDEALNARCIGLMELMVDRMREQAPLGH
jgi:hypothetical protein